MVTLLSHLEPRSEEAGTVLFKTIEEVDEIFFIEKGTVDIGFEINRETRFIIRLKQGGVIGAYNLTFNTKTLFLYRVKDTFCGLTIRKDHWNRIMNEKEYDDITSYIKEKVETEYNKKIKKVMIIE